MELQVDAVEQAQQLEFVLGQLARQPTAHLVAELGDALVEERPIELVIEVHVSASRSAVRGETFPYCRTASASCRGQSNSRHLGQRDGRTGEADAFAQISRLHTTVDHLHRR